MKLILSDTFYGAYEGVADELKKRRDGEAAHIILVPDEFTMSVERGILTTLRETAAFDIEVLSFSRLAVKLLRQRIERCLTPEGSVMLLKKVIDEKKDDFKYYKRSRELPGFAKDMYAALTELRNSGVSGGDIRAVGGGLKASVKNKYDDLALLYDGYLGALAGRHSDSSTRLEALAEYIDKETVLPYHVYICDFYEFTSPQLKVISALSSRALSLTMGIVQSSGGGNARLYPYETRLKLERVEELAGTRVETLYRRDRLTRVQSRIATGLYAFDGEEAAETGGAVRLLKCGGVYAEAEEIAKSIRELVVEKKYRYSDIAVVAGDMDEYAPVIKGVFKRFGIPYFLDRKETLAEQASARFLLSALTAASTYAAEDVLDFVKNPFFPVKPDGFESYVLKYNIAYSRFTSPFAAGDDGERTAAEEVRKVLFSALSPLTAAAKKEYAPASERIEATEEFYKAVSYAEIFEELYGRVNEDSPFYADCLVQSEKKIKDIFKEIRGVYGNAPISFTAFTELLASMCDSVKIALAPLYVDTVFVGELGESRYADIKALFLAGASQGAIPGVKRRVSVLTEQDESAFERSGKPLISAVKKTARYDIFFLIQLLIKAKDFITVSYSETSRGGDALSPSSLFGELSAVLSSGGKPLKTDIPGIRDASDYGTEEAAAQAFARFFSTEANAAYEICRASGELPPERAGSFRAADAALSKEVRRRIDRVAVRTAVPLYPQPVDRRFSASRLETYFACPYMYYFKYRLRLKKRDDGGLESTDAGLIIHDVLERYFKLAIKNGGRYDLPDDETYALVGRIADAVIKEKYLRQAERAADRHFLERVKRECQKTAVEMTALVRESGFKPWLIEARIGAGGRIPALKLSKDGVETEIEGKIDRIDRFGNYVAVIDYKSYAGAELKPAQILNGEKIQLLVYLDALLKSDGSLLPAVAAYMPVYDKFDTKDNAKRYKYKGLIAAPSEIIRELDPHCGNKERSRTGEAKGAAERAYKGVKTEEIFPIALSYVEALILAAVTEIADGEIAPSPIKGKCAYCDYAELCAYKEYVRER
ncbi:MAG: exodeoxyribonuclease V subunit gamma [Clostridiaceae bacterium]|jgi:ATP-dependent helicase/nuclease subunit B|nr:exodeoxyribonuclease V subunit gamma [Clostridiaceae bacterium]